MTGALYRMRKMVERRGETFMVGANSHVGIFGFAAHADARNYLSEAALSGANSPLYAIMVRDDDTTLPTDSIVWAGMTLTIHGIVARVQNGATLFKLIFAS